MIQAQVVPDSIVIWPSSVGPGSETLNIVQTSTNRTLSGTCTVDRAIEKVTIPTLVSFVPAQPNGVSVILCPGGGYQRVVIDIEGSDIARWFNDRGITAFVLTYRLPIDAHLNKENVPLQDIQRAIRYVKRNASTWGLDSTRVGVLGASAGGHVATSLSTGFNKQVYAPIDAIDQVSARPSFQILLYPVISMDATITHAGSRTNLIGSSPSQAVIDEFSTEKQIKPNTPPAFIAVAKDDGSVPPANSQRFHDSLLANNISSELHMYEDGGHGKGICKAVGTDFAKWVIDCEAWLQQQQLINGVFKSDKNFTTDRSFEIYPNPISSESQMYFTLTEKSHICITLLDSSGKATVKKIHEGEYNAGQYSIPLSKSYFPASGLYYLQLDDQKTKKIQKVVLQK